MLHGGWDTARGENILETHNTTLLHTAGMSVTHTTPHSVCTLCLLSF